MKETIVFTSAEKGRGIDVILYISKKPERGKRGGRLLLDVELMSYKISKLDMANNLKSSSQVKLINSVSSECRWINGEAVLTLVATLQQCGHPNLFYINLILEGHFLTGRIKSNAEKKEIHAICYQKLLVYANAILSQLAENSGMEGVHIRNAFLKPEHVQYGPKPSAVKNGKIVRLCSNGEQQ